MEPDVHVHLHVGKQVVDVSKKLDELLFLAVQERARDQWLAEQICEIADAIKEPSDSETAKRLHALAARLRGMLTETHPLSAAASAASTTEAGVIQ